MARSPVPDTEAKLRRLTALAIILTVPRRRFYRLFRVAKTRQAQLSSQVSRYKHESRELLAQRRDKLQSCLKLAQAAAICAGLEER